MTSNCKNCGASLTAKLATCEYCGSLNPNVASGRPVRSSYINGGDIGERVPLDFVLRNPAAISAGLVATMLLSKPPLRRGPPKSFWRSLIESGLEATRVFARFPPFRL